ncbi:MAG TPA: hypothetical protein VF140_08025 [Phycicoccus sp.]
MDAAFAQHLDRVRAHRAELGDSMAALDAALAVEEDDAAVSRRRVRAALTELAHDLRGHVEITEAPDGIYAGLRSAAPRLASRVDVQLAEHRTMLEEVDRLLEERDSGLEGEDAVAAHRQAVSDLLATLRRHRTRGADLMYEAYDVDIGGSG